MLEFLAMAEHLIGGFDAAAAPLGIALPPHVLVPEPLSLPVTQ